VIFFEDLSFPSQRTDMYTIFNLPLEIRATFIPYFIIVGVDNGKTEDVKHSNDYSLKV
jgi:hypothetical protein